MLIAHLALPSCLPAVPQKPAFAKAAGAALAAAALSFVMVAAPQPALAEEQKADVKAVLCACKWGLPSLLKHTMVLCTHAAVVKRVI